MKQVRQSASVLTNELLHVYLLSKLATFIQAKLSFSKFEEIYSENGETKPYD